MKDFVPLESTWQNWTTLPHLLVQQIRKTSTWQQSLTLALWGALGGNLNHQTWQKKNRCLHIISYHIILYYIISYYTVLYYIILNCITSYHIALYYTILYYIILYHVISCYIILYYILLCHIILHCIILLYHIVMLHHYYIFSKLN